MGKTKVLYITYNGVGEDIFQSQCLPYLKGLSGKGHDITLLSYERDFTNAAKYAAIMNALGIRWFRLRYHKRPRAIVTLYDFIFGMKFSFWIMLAGGIDIVHARATHGAVIGVLPAKLLRRKFIFDTRGLDSEEYVDGGLIRRGSFMHRLMLLSERIIFSLSDGIVVLSENSKNLLKERGFYGYFENAVNSVIPCVADLDLFKPAAKKDSARHGAFNLIYIGSVGTWYMLDEMLEFFAVLKKRYDGSKFSVYTQSGQEIIKKKVGAMGLEDSVSFQHREHNIIARHIQDSDLGIALINPASSKRASSPTKIGEYLACGIPVIVNSGIGDAEKIVRDNRAGVVINSFGKAAYENAIDELEDLLKDPGLSDRCRLTAEKNFSLNDAVSRYDIMYEKLMNI